MRIYFFYNTVGLSVTRLLFSLTFLLDTATCTWLVSCNSKVMHNSREHPVTLLFAGFCPCIKVFRIFEIYVF